MPTLTWAGKDKIVNHHHEVPFRTLEKQESFLVSDQNSTGNRIIHGDNLEALKSLLPEFEGEINLIYIDPPYNTGKEDWKYNDNVSDPLLLRWLGKVVGKEEEDMSRHDKWLCMMYPRLKLLRRLLKDDGVIFISIDRNEFHHLKCIMNEIFGVTNWVGEICWNNVTDNNPTNIALEHEYILCFAKNKKKIASVWKAEIAAKERMIEVGDQFIKDFPDQTKRQKAYKAWLSENKHHIWPFEDYKLIDDDGIYTGMRAVHNPGKEGYRYDVIHTETQKPCKQPMNGYRFPESTMQELIDSGRIIFGKDENKIVELKVYVKDYKSKFSSVMNLEGRAGTNEIKAIFTESNRHFDYPKPSAIIEDLISFASKPGDNILDSFAGSGTTGHATLKVNTQDAGGRKFILIEWQGYAQDTTAERIKRVMTGYGAGDKTVPGLGGGFDYYTLGDTLFDENDHINENVDIDIIRDYISYCEGIKEEERQSINNPVSPYLVGLNREMAWVFNYEPGKVTSLDIDFLASFKFEGKRPRLAIIYADHCLIEKETLAEIGIKFKKIPRDISHF